MRTPFNFLVVEDNLQDINLINALNTLRQWERNNLPFCKTNAGYHVFLVLTIEVIKREPRLKNLYHSLPYSEVTIRVLLRQLEMDGWIQFPQKENDHRHKNIKITPKFEKKYTEWINQVSLIK